MAQRVRTAASCGRLCFNRSIRDNPNRLVAIRQQDVINGWPAFPGQNALRIKDVINDHLQSVVNKSKARAGRSRRWPPPYSRFCRAARAETLRPSERRPSRLAGAGMALIR
jgi:hypothetical protein